MPASQTQSVSYRIGEAASGGMGAISQPANQSESGPGPDPVFQRYSRQDRSCSVSGPTHVLGAGLKGAMTRLMHRSNDEAMSSFRQAGGLQSLGGYLIAEFWA